MSTIPIQRALLVRVRDALFSAGCMLTNATSDEHIQAMGPDCACPLCRAWDAMSDAEREVRAVLGEIDEGTP